MNGQDLLFKSVLRMVAFRKARVKHETDDATEETSAERRPIIRQGLPVDSQCVSRIMRPKAGVGPFTPYTICLDRRMLVFEDAHSCDGSSVRQSQTGSLALL